MRGSRRNVLVRTKLFIQVVRSVLRLKYVLETAGTSEGWRWGRELLRWKTDKRQSHPGTQAHQREELNSRKQGGSRGGQRQTKPQEDHPKIKVKWDKESTFLLAS